MRRGWNKIAQHTEGREKDFIGGGRRFSQTGMRDARERDFRAAKSQSSVRKTMKKRK